MPLFLGPLLVFSFHSKKKKKEEEEEIEK